MSSDAIMIRKLRVPTHIGVTDEERARPQVVSVDLTMHADLRRSAISDDLADTVDYDRVLVEITGLIRSSKTRLMEHLAEEIANHISRYPLIDRVTVEISKPEFRPGGIDVAGVSVKIERTF